MVTIADLGKVQTVAEAAAPVQKLCINCKYIATNGSGNWETYRCMAPQNPSVINLVTGDKIYEVPLCITQRKMSTDGYCTGNGDWWEQKSAVSSSQVIFSKPLPTASKSKSRLPDADEL